MNKILFGSLIACAAMCLAGCGGGNTAAVSDGYKSSAPSDPNAPKGPVGAGVGDSDAGSSESAPPPPPL